MAKIQSNDRFGFNDYEKRNLEADYPDHHHNPHRRQLVVLRAVVHCTLSLTGL